MISQKTIRPIAERHLAEIGEFADFPAGWNETADAVLEHLPYGSIRHRMVISPDGLPLYDIPHFLEPGGSAVLPLASSGKAGLVSIDRPAILKPETRGSYPDYVLPDDFGRRVWEAPRGNRNVGETARNAAERELLEEIGLTPRELLPAGVVSSNSAFLATTIDLFLAVVDEPLTPLRVQASEGLRELRFFDLAGIRSLLESGALICSISESLILRALLQGRIR